MTIFQSLHLPHKKKENNMKELIFSFSFSELWDKYHKTLYQKVCTLLKKYVHTRSYLLLFSLLFTPCFYLNNLRLLLLLLFDDIFLYSFFFFSFIVSFFLFFTVRSLVHFLEINENQNLLCLRSVFSPFTMRFQYSLRHEQKCTHQKFIEHSRLNSL